MPSNQKFIKSSRYYSLNKAKRLLEVSTWQGRDNKSFMQKTSFTVKKYATLKE